MDKDTSQQLKIKKTAGNTNDDSGAAIVREEPTKEVAQGSATSSADQAMMELKEMKHNI